MLKTIAISLKVEPKNEFYCRYRVGTMIVVCEKCKNRYHIEDFMLDSHGRYVRCFSCKHVWLQKNEKDKQDPSPKSSGKKGFFSSFFQQIFRIVFYLSLLMAIIAVVAGVCFVPSVRGWVEKNVPSSQVFYQTLALYQRPSPHQFLSIQGVSVHFIKSRWQQQDSDRRKERPGNSLNNTSPDSPPKPFYVFSIEGRVTNKTPVVQKLPPLYVHLKKTREKSEILKRWKYRLPKNEALPGETMPFTVIVEHDHDPKQSVFFVSFQDTLKTANSP